MIRPILGGLDGPQRGHLPSAAGYGRKNVFPGFSDQRRKSTVVPSPANCQGQRVAPCRRQSEPPQSPTYVRRGSADSCLASAIKSPCGVSVEAVAIEVTAFGP